MKTTNRKTKNTNARKKRLMRLMRIMRIRRIVRMQVNFWDADVTIIAAAAARAAAAAAAAVPGVPTVADTPAIDGWKELTPRQAMYIHKAQKQSHESRDWSQAPNWEGRLTGPTIESDVSDRFDLDLSGAVNTTWSVGLSAPLPTIPVLPGPWPWSWNLLNYRGPKRDPYASSRDIVPESGNTSGRMVSPNGDTRARKERVGYRIHTPRTAKLWRIGGQYTLATRWNTDSGAEECISGTLVDVLLTHGRRYCLRLVQTIGGQSYKDLIRGLSQSSIRGKSPNLSLMEFRATKARILSRTARQWVSSPYLPQGYIKRQWRNSAVDLYAVSEFESPAPTDVPIPSYKRLRETVLRNNSRIRRIRAVLQTQTGSSEAIPWLLKSLKFSGILRDRAKRQIAVFFSK